MSLEKPGNPAIKSSYLPPIYGALALLVYLGALQFQFVYDDVLQIVDNPSIRSWRFLPQYFNSHVWTGILPTSAYYRPFELLWFRINYGLFGLSTPGWHLTSILAHAIATILVFYLVARLLQDVASAAISSLIFGLHPIHVQSAAWVSGIPDPLLTIFICGSVICYLKFRDNDRRAWLYYSLVLYACALLTKEPGIILPVLILAVELRTPADNLASGRTLHRIKQAVNHILPFLGITLAYVAARVHALKGFSPAKPYVSFAQMVLTWPSILWHDTKLLLLPWGYSLYYELPPVEHIWSREFLVPAGLLVLTAGILVLLSLLLKLRRGLSITALVWFALPLLPSLYLRGLDPATFGQDRYLYLSCVGFAMFVGAIIVAVSEMAILRNSSRSIQVYAAAIVVALLASCTLVQQQYWTSNIALFRRATVIAPNHTHALNNLAVNLAEEREFGPAIVFFERGLRLDPNSSPLNYNYGRAMYQAGDYKHALPLLAKAIQFDPSFGEAFLYMGLSHLKLGNLHDAHLEIRRAMALEPERRGVHLAMAVILEAEGDLQGAQAETRIEANNFPDDPIIQQRLTMLEQKGELKPVAKAQP